MHRKHGSNSRRSRIRGRNSGGVHWHIGKRAVQSSILDFEAAAFSLTQSLRSLWAGRGVKVHAVLAGPVNTDMTRSLNIPKVSPESVARAILNGMEKGEEDIFPDPMSEGIADGWHSGVAKALERQFAAYTPESMAR